MGKREEAAQQEVQRGIGRANHREVGQVSPHRLAAHQAKRIVEHVPFAIVDLVGIRGGDQPMVQQLEQITDSTDDQQNLTYFRQPITGIGANSDPGGDRYVNCSRKLSGILAKVHSRARRTSRPSCASRRSGAPSGR